VVLEGRAPTAEGDVLLALAARVVWTSAGECGLAFVTPQTGGEIDLEEVALRLAEAG
jgi:hypothetical protein